jgi:hypothetical protein
MAQLPILDDKFVVLAISPPEPKPPAPKRWTFSFRHWRQIEYFGLDRTDSGWFASLLQKLTVLSEEEVDRFICDSHKLDVWRYHRIDWGHKNIPIQPKDLSWIPKEITNNKEEFILVQFQISTGLGRVVGFWDRDYIFNIVLLDPLHNLQPSKDHNYRVDPCSPLSCDYTKLLHSLDSILESYCKDLDCNIAKYIQNIPNSRESLKHNNVLMIKTTDEDIDIAQSLINEGKIKTFSDLFRDGLKYHTSSAISSSVHT